MTGDDELRIARIVSEHSVWALGREIGAPILYDDGRRDSLVDIVFRHTEPPIALEVTQVVDAELRSTHSAALRAVEGLRATAQQVGRGSWWFYLKRGTSVKALTPALAELMTTLDPPEGRNLRGDALPENLREAGLISVGLDRSGPSTADIATTTGVVAMSLSGLSGDLAVAINDNQAKLSQMDGHERHLVVWNRALRAGDPVVTPTPDLPRTIDFLWVIRTRDAPTPSAVVWVTSAKWSGWKTKGEPHD